MEEGTLVANTTSAAHRSTTLWEEEGAVEVSLYICGAQKLVGPSELSRVDNGSNGIGCGNALGRGQDPG